MHEDVIKLIEDSLKKYCDDINLICISLEYFLTIKKLDQCNSILQNAESAFPNDPRIYLFKFMIGEILGNPDPSFLKKAIDLDPKYFKPYIYLGNFINSGKESEKIFKKALEFARTYDEIFTAYQLYFVVKAQNDIYLEFPDIFESQ